MQQCEGFFFAVGTFREKKSREKLIKKTRGFIKFTHKNTEMGAKVHFFKIDYYVTVFLI